MDYLWNFPADNLPCTTETLMFHHALAPNRYGYLLGGILYAFLGYSAAESFDDEPAQSSWRSPFT